MTTEQQPVVGLALLRTPFPHNQISKLPKESKAQADERKQNRNAGVNCAVCGGWHHRSAVHLDYVGHAALTDRLLDADPCWNWEPMGVDDRGLPALDNSGGLWIKLTVCGVTRLGYGSADGKQGGDAMKERIGDALRNAAMRFGAALDLWHKGDLHAHLGSDDRPEPPEPNVLPSERLAWFLANIEATKSLRGLTQALHAGQKEADEHGDVKARTEIEAAVKKRADTLGLSLTAEAA